MQATLLLIDPQNDFCDVPGAALPVPGANSDMQAVAAFMHAARNSLHDAIVTLDSHSTVSIERTSFWLQGDGAPVPPFTQITEDAVRAGQYKPRNESVLPKVLWYLNALEGSGRYQLIVWPIHCVLGTWGHNIHTAILEELAAWEIQQQRGAFKVLKGLNPMTEQYSAIRAEVPDPSDPCMGTNNALISRARPREWPLLVAGEASSHCVAATMEHLFEQLTTEERRRIMVLRDCMSPVPGFEPQADQFFAKVEADGGRVMTSAEALTLLTPTAPGPTHPSAA